MHWHASLVLSNWANWVNLTTKDWIKGKLDCVIQDIYKYSFTTKKDWMRLSSSVFLIPQKILQPFSRSSSSVSALLNYLSVVTQRCVPWAQTLFGLRFTDANCERRRKANEMVHISVREDIWFGRLDISAVNGFVQYTGRLRDSHTERLIQIEWKKDQKIYQWVTNSL